MDSLQTLPSTILHLFRNDHFNNLLLARVIIMRGWEGCGVDASPGEGSIKANRFPLPHEKVYVPGRRLIDSN